MIHQLSLDEHTWWKTRIWSNTLFSYNLFYRLSISGKSERIEDWRKYIFYSRFMWVKFADLQEKQYFNFMYHLIWLWLNPSIFLIFRCRKTTFDLFIYRNIVICNIKYIQKVWVIKVYKGFFPELNVHIIHLNILCTFFLSWKITTAVRMCYCPLLLVLRNFIYINIHQIIFWNNIFQHDTKNIQRRKTHFIIKSLWKFFRASLQ